MFFLDWLKKLFRKKKGRVGSGKVIILHEGDHVYNPKYPQPNRYVPVAGSQAIHQDISKFMKHGRQTLEYRRSCKARIQPDEDD
jgi:hypothetical protein